MITFLLHSDVCAIGWGFLFPVLQVLLLLFGIGTFVLDQPGCVLGLFLVVAVNMAISFSMKRRYEACFYSLASLKQVLQMSKWMISDETRRQRFASEKIVRATKDLRKLTSLIYGMQSRKNLSMSGDMLGILNDYLMGVTLCDVVSFNHILKMIQHKQEQVLQLYEFVGNIDMEIAIASFRKSEQYWCRPTFAEEHSEPSKYRERNKHSEYSKYSKNRKPSMDVKMLVHPLLKHPVDNDFTLQDRVIITGANASGKSTFMKAVAVNAILAQTIDTCVAKSCSMPRLSVMTCMSLRDDILSGESYYIRETKYLKRMLDQIRKPVWTLCVIDEILKGTNTLERLAASNAILRYLVDKNGFIMVATHDMELVHQLKDQYETYYFESKITKEDIKFDYHIHKGIGGKSNAIALLSLLHFPEEIVNQAKHNIGRMNG